MGFSSESWEVLAVAIQDHARENDVVKVEDTEFGTRYVVEGQIRTPSNRDPDVRIVWFIERGIIDHAWSLLIRWKEEIYDKRT